MAEIIDGRRFAQQIRHDLQGTVSQLTQTGARAPSLAVVLVGDDPASHVYVKYKEKACLDVGIRSQTFRLSADSEESEVLALVDKLNADEEVDGILVQLPLPAAIDRYKVVSRIAPFKDVDGLGPQNQGLLALGLACFVPCTPLGVMKLLQAIDFKVAGKRAVVIGRSLLVGAPLVRLLTHAHATVTNVHSQTPHPGGLCCQADVLVVATGVHRLVNEAWIKKGAVVIDVGIHRIGGRLEGDVDFTRARNQASYITPVPGGVGPMTIACLLSNCVKAYQWKLQNYTGFGSLPLALP